MKHEARGREVVGEGKGLVKYVVMEGDQTLGNEHTMQYTDNVL